MKLAEVLAKINEKAVFDRICAVIGRVLSLASCEEKDDQKWEGTANGENQGK